jgi:hypothetical protein
LHVASGWADWLAAPIGRLRDHPRPCPQPPRRPRGQTAWCRGRASRTAPADVEAAIAVAGRSRRAIATAKALAVTDSVTLCRAVLVFCGFEGGSSSGFGGATCLSRSTRPFARGVRIRLTSARSLARETLQCFVASSAQSGRSEHPPGRTWRGDDRRRTGARDPDRSGRTAKRRPCETQHRL